MKSIVSVVRLGRAGISMFIIKVILSPNAKMQYTVVM